MRQRRHGILAYPSLLLLGATICIGRARAEDLRRFDLPRQDLKYALRSVTRAAGLELYAQTKDLRGRQSPEIHAALSVQQALDELLVGTNLEADIEGKAVFVRGRSPAASSTVVAEPATPAEIVVTGTHIRGAAIASRTITLSDTSIREAGQTSIGEAVRDLPQNFSGGQNPGIIGEGNQRGDNLNSSSTINLRGLGPDATLTLINGHRVAYTGSIQGVDLDQIPLAALDRIEIVADGASAVYGSDAVGGVANILLKRDYTGATLSARVGAATGGGDVEQQYDLTTGARWTGGGFLAAASVRRNTLIRGSERAITKDLGPELSLYPAVHQYGFVLAGHEDLAPRLHIELDTTYDHRATGSSFPSGPDHVVTIDGSTSQTREQTYEISPRLIYDISEGWHSSLTATYAADDTNGDIQAYSGGELFDVGHYGYRNRTVDAELSADGPVFHLPGGSARIAVGGGYRRNHLLATNQADLLGVAQDPTRIPAHQQSYYGYAELNLPLLSASNAVWGVDRLSASAAIRYENYPGIDHLATPKLGLVYAPTRDLTLKASWGKSFKTPTLYQQHQLLSAVLIPSDYFGDGAPAGTNSIFLSGGNPNLKPERATSWSTTLDWHPVWFAGFSAGVSVFRIDYRDRVAEPVESISGVFTNPIYEDLIDRSPSPAMLMAIPAEAGSGFSNFTGAPYDPTTVYAVIDDRNLNSARERVHGLDLDLAYKSNLGADQSIALSGDISHLVSSRKLSALQPALALAGTIFNAPHWRGHASLVWSWQSLTLASDVTYTGGITDNRQPGQRHVRGMAPVDLTATYRLAIQRSAIKSLDVILAVRDIQNAMPARIFNQDLYDPTFDSNNYSAIGRTINLTLSASF